MSARSARRRTGRCRLLLCALPLRGALPRRRACATAARRSTRLASLRWRRTSSRPCVDAHGRKVRRGQWPIPGRAARDAFAGSLHRQAPAERRSCWSRTGATCGSTIATWSRQRCKPLAQALPQSPAMLLAGGAGLQRGVRRARRWPARWPGLGRGPAQGQGVGFPRGALRLSRRRAGAHGDRRQARTALEPAVHAMCSAIGRCDPDEVRFQPPPGVGRDRQAAAAVNDPRCVPTCSIRVLWFCIGAASLLAFVIVDLPDAGRATCPTSGFPTRSSTWLPTWCWRSGSPASCTRRQLRCICCWR